MHLTPGEHVYTFCKARTPQKVTIWETVWFQNIEALKVFVSALDNGGLNVQYLFPFSIFYLQIYIFLRILVLFYGTESQSLLLYCYLIFKDQPKKETFSKADLFGFIL